MTTIEAATSIKSQDNEQNSAPVFEELAHRRNVFESEDSVQETYEID